MLEKVRGGISIEDPCMFAYGGRYYYFLAMLSNPDTSIGAMAFDNKHLEMFEYTNEINSLCLYGSIVYTDLDGMVSRYINRMDNHVEVACQQMEKVSDGKDMEEYRPMKRIDGAEFFKHSFIVQNIAIIGREHQAIKYKITLISTAWYLLCSEIAFSNYGNSETKNGYLMLKKFLADALASSNNAFLVDSNSFDVCSETAKDIEIPFMTNGNDNIFSVKKYIFDKLYWSKNQIDKSLKYLIYNPVTSKYHCIDYSNESLWLPSEKPFVLYSLFETDYEQELFSIENGLASVAKKNQTSTYEDLFGHIVWQYDSKTGSFFNAASTFKQKDMSELYNRKPNGFSKMAKSKTEEKYMKELRPEWFKNKDTYHHQTSDTNRSFSIYQTIIDNMMKRDAFLIDTEGDITHQPGTCLGIVIDRTMKSLPEMDSKEKEEIDKKHHQLDGLFPVLKATHRYHLANSKDTPVFYREELLFARNFILKNPNKV